MSGLISNITAKAMSTTQTQERKAAKVWLNVGFNHPTLTDKNGNPLRCTLPLGIPLDTIQDGTYNSTSPLNVITSIECGNELKRQLLQIAENMENGECKDISEYGLSLYLQKTKEVTVVKEKVTESASEVVAHIFAK